jgi:hypothetical protein
LIDSAEFESNLKLHYHELLVEDEVLKDAELGHEVDFKKRTLKGFLGLFEAAD